MSDVELYDQDAESYVDGVKVLGQPVDPAPGHRTAYAAVTAAADVAAKPIVPAWMRNPSQRAEAIRGAGRLAAHRTGYHLTRTPKYTARVALWAPVGALRVIARVLGWAADGGGLDVRLDAARRLDAADYLALHRHRDRRVAWRGWVLAAGAAAALAAGLLDWLAAPAWAQWSSLAAAVLVFARAGRPQDRPILDRVTIGEPFTRLTAEMVRSALTSIGLARIKAPSDVSFAQPGIHRDSGGWLAPVILPAGVEAVTVIERRGALASALRLPLDQVWPSVGQAHPGVLDLWVAGRPVSAMGAPRWELASERARTSIFEGYAVGHDERHRPVRFTPFERNMLIGGQPGSGKTSAARAVVLGALLDPTAEVRLAAFKPAEDFADVEPFCTTYVCGLDEASVDAGEAMVTAALAEVQRRQTLLGKLRRDGKIPEGRTTPELARAGLGLHPLILVFDEVHELFLSSKTAAEAMARLLKQGRSAGVVVVLVTQVAGRESVPPEITRVVSSRWCLSVLDQVANDQVMGTGAYKRGLSGTQFRPGVDAGWGVTSGVADRYEGPARAYRPSERDLRALLARIAAVRAGSAFPVGDPATPRRDLVDDVLHVFAETGAPKLHWTTIAARLAELHPAYAGITAEAVSATLRAAGVTSKDVRVAGRVAKGCELQALHAEAARRAIGP